MKQDRGLALLDEMLAEGSLTVSAKDVRVRLQLSPQAASNLLRRLADAGLLERVRPGSYAIRSLGVLGTASASENLTVAVAAAMPGIAHRIGYRSALDELGLIVHPARTIQVAVARQVRKASVSGRPLRPIIETPDKVHVGAQADGPSWISTIERALLDAAARPRLVGGITVLAEALAAAAPKADPIRLVGLAEELNWGAALRRIGSIADRLKLEGLCSQLTPLSDPRTDIELEPNGPKAVRWRDPRWWIRWNYELEEIQAAVEQ